MRGHALGSIAAVAVLLASCQRAPVAPAPVAAKTAAATPDLPAAARLSRATQRLELSAYKDAELEFRALLTGPEAASARLGLGQVLVKTGRASEAITVLAPLLRDPARSALAASFTAPDR